MIASCKTIGDVRVEAWPGSYRLIPVPLSGSALESQHGVSQTCRKHLALVGWIELSLLIHECLISTCPHVFPTCPPLLRAAQFQQPVRSLRELPGSSIKVLALSLQPINSIAMML